LVVIAIIGIVALLLPAIQAAREAARRTQCNNNLKNLSLGLQNYHDTYKTFPMGVMRRNNSGNAAMLGPSWQFGILPFMEQRNIYDKIMQEIRPGQQVGNFCADQINSPPNANAVAGAPLTKLVPDYMRCPSSPLPVMETQVGPICMSTYTGIAGGTDIIPADSTTDGGMYPGGSNGQPPSTTRSYINRYLCSDSGAFIASSGMLPPCEHVGMQGCSDGTSNTMIVGEQSDWLRAADKSVSSKYHGDPGWRVGSGTAGGWVSGTTQFNNVGQHYAANATPPRTDPNAQSTAIAWGGGPMFNISTVRYKPDEKNVLAPGPGGGGGANVPMVLPGCAEERGSTNAAGHNNPLQSPHPGGLLVAFVDGSVQFISGTTDLGVFLRIAIRDDGQNVKLD
jgi:type II secretory pathway pseudopilin PulG